jgi:Short C-terminal domain
MFVRRRRPLMTAAMVGGTAYVAGKAGQRSASRQEQAAMQEQDQEARLAQLEAQQAAAAAPPPAPAAPAAAPQPDMVAQLSQLKELLDSGAITQQEFDTAKQKLLAG